MVVRRVFFRFRPIGDSVSQPVRTIIGNVVSAFLSRGINLISTLLIVPMAVLGLGTDDYAILALVLSATILFAFSDLGLGLAVVNRVSNWRSNPEEARGAIRRAFWTLTFISVAVAIICLAWIALIFVAAAANGTDHRSLAVAVALLMTSLGLPAGLAQRIMFGLQKGLTAALWTTAARLASLAGVALAFHLQAELLVYVLAIVGLPVLVGWVNAAWLFTKARPDLSPLSGAGRLLPYRQEVADGLSFLTLQVAVYAEFGIDSLLISLARGADEVAYYDVMARMFGYLPALVSIGAFPLWPALRRAMDAGDRAAERRLLRWAYLLTAAVCIVGGLPLAAFHAVAASAWVRVAFAPDYVLAFGWVAFVLATCMATVQGMYLNAAGLIIRQAKFMIPFVLILLLAKWGIARYGDLAALPLVTALLIVVRMIIFSRWKTASNA